MKKIANSLGLHPGDAAVIAAVLAAALLWLLLPFGAGDAHSVSVTTETGEVLYPLSADGTFAVVSGGYNLTLEIRGGNVWVSASDCPGGDCMHTGTVTRSGQSIVCLPARVIVKITGEVDSDADWILP